MSMANQSLASVIFVFSCLLCFSAAMSTEARAVTMKENQDYPYQNQWCIVKPSTPNDQLDRDIQFCCNQPQHPIYNCTMIERGGPCYNPTNKVSNASVVMHLYYQNNGKHRHNCKFNDSGIFVYEDPSVGSCIYPLY